MNNFLSLLGLALRGNRLAAGDEPTALAAESGKARLILTASDASPNTLRRAERLAETGRCLRLDIPFTKAELGGALGRSGTAIAALTDLGLAAAAVSRLADMDPERYREASARMELKVRRAAERKSAQGKGEEKKRRPPRERPKGPPRKGPPGDPEARRGKPARPGGGPQGASKPPSRDRRKGPGIGEHGPGRSGGPRPWRRDGKGRTGPKGPDRPGRPGRSGGPRGPAGGGR